VNDVGILVAALVAAETQVRQGYFLFWLRVTFTLDARERAAAFRRGAGAGRFFTPSAPRLLAAARGADGFDAGFASAGARFGSACGDR
jgi:hypothetical protein